MTYGFKFNETAQQLGFRDGDILVATDKGEVVRFDGKVDRPRLPRPVGSPYRHRVARRSGSANRPARDLNLLDMIKEEPPFINILSPSVIDSVMPGSPAAQAGMRAGDRLVHVQRTAPHDVERIR